MASSSPLTSACILLHNLDTKKHYIIAKSLASRKTVLIKINHITGELSFTNSPGKDVFNDEDGALEYLKKGGCELEEVGHGKALLGYVVVGPVGLLLMAEKVRVSATLPGGHEVKTVTVSKWHRIPLQQPEIDSTARTTKEEFDRGVEKITTFQIDGCHYFCETLDVTRPFPSDRPVSQPSWEFCWNRWLSQSFRSVALDSVCPPLLQGLAEARQLEDFDGRSFYIALLSRKGRLHVGPRYKARGLNDCADPGNEIECEQVVWVESPKANGSVAWSRYVWRRGSVPIWWTVSIKNSGIGEAEIKIRHTQTFKGSRRYVRRLQKRYMVKPDLEPDPPEGEKDGVAGDPSLQLPSAFISLLRKGTPDRDRSEAKLASAYDFVVNQLKKEHNLPLTYISLDWHEMDKQLGTEGIVEAFWSTLRGVLPAHGFALGTLSKVGRDHNDPDPPEEPGWVVLPEEEGMAGSSERCCSSVGRGWQARWFKQQRGVTRYNCADSLDRTNVASFFGAVQVLVEQCRELDIAIVATSPGAASLARQVLARKVGTPLSTKPPSQAAQTQIKSGFMKLEKLGNQLNKGLGGLMLKSPQRSPRDATSEAGCPLPMGWEAKVDAGSKRVFYIDHNTKTTTWERPRAPSPPDSTPSTPPPESSPAADSDKEDTSYEPLTPWCMIGKKVRTFGKRVAPEALSVMAELFLVNGDLSARLYTGSPAMHSDKILIFEPEASKLRKAGAGVYGNSLIAIQRRYNNVMVDTDKQQQLEIFLGMRPSMYFTSVPLLYKDENSVPTDYPETDDEGEQVGQLDWPVRESRPLSAMGDMPTSSVSMVLAPSPRSQSFSTFMDLNRSSPRHVSSMDDARVGTKSMAMASAPQASLAGVSVLDEFFGDSSNSGSGGHLSGQSSPRKEMMPKVVEMPDLLI